VDHEDVNNQVDRSMGVKLFPRQTNPTTKHKGQAFEKVTVVRVIAPLTVDSNSSNYHYQEIP